MIYKDFTSFKSAKGITFDPTKWLIVTQEMIDHFAKATHDHQWIHVDQKRAAAESPFKKTIAHGFLSLEDDTLLSYKCGSYYSKESEGSVNYNDPVIRHVINNKDTIKDVIEINLPHHNEKDLLISDKDKNAPKFLYRRHE